jgi:hypothetical protein
MPDEISIAGARMSQRISKAGNIKYALSGDDRFVASVEPARIGLIGVPWQRSGSPILLRRKNCTALLSGAIHRGRASHWTLPPPAKDRYQSSL